MRYEKSFSHLASQDSLRLREAISEDVTSLARVHVDSWSETYEGIVPDDYLYSLKYTDRKHMWEKLIPRRPETGLTLVVVNSNDDVVGFIDCGPAREHEHGIPGEVYALYVLKRYHGLGLGKELMSCVHEFFKSLNFDSFYLWVLEDNPTKNFYEKVEGKKVKSQPINIGNSELLETLYCWDIS